MDQPGRSPGPTFEEFVASRGRDLWRTAWLLTGDSHKAEDLVQTTLAKCWSRWSSIAKGGSPEAYVRRAMLNTYTDWWRRRWNGERPTEVLPETASRFDGSVDERVEGTQGGVQRRERPLGLVGHRARHCAGRRARWLLGHGVVSLSWCGP